MIDRLVVNASPLIVLSKARHIGLLEGSAREIVVPSAVLLEVTAGPKGDPGRLLLESGWGRRPESCPIPDAIREWGLGAGESEVLALTLGDNAATAVLDDAQGRRCARSIGVPVIGTLGLILRAKRRGIIPSASEALRGIVASGLHIDDALLRSILPRLLGEAWPPE